MCSWASFHISETTYSPAQNKDFCFVPSRGIEPLLQDPQSCVLSVERRGPHFASVFTEASRGKHHVKPLLVRPKLECKRERRRKRRGLFMFSYPPQCSGRGADMVSQILDYVIPLLLTSMQALIVIGISRLLCSASGGAGSGFARRNDYYNAMPLRPASRTLKILFVAK
jgi:hypothetical protein